MLCTVSEEQQTESGQALDRRYEIRMRYETIAAYPLFVISLGFVCGFIMVIDSPNNPEYLGLGRILMFLGWIVFLADYVIGLVLAFNRRRYFATHIIQLVAIILPPLRILLIGRAIRSLASGAKRRFAGRVRIYTLYLTTLIMVAGAATEYAFERVSPQANITSFTNALWWTAETISTVGYGDFYPVTWGGRIVALVLFVNGIALLSAVTASIAAKVLDYDDTTDEESNVNLSDLNHRLISIEQQLAVALATIQSQTGKNDEQTAATPASGNTTSG